MDNRTKKQKLEAMARQKVSPNEAAIAQKKLEAMAQEESELNNATFDSIIFSGGTGFATHYAGRAEWARTISFTMSGTMDWQNVFGTRSRSYTISTKE